MKSRSTKKCALVFGADDAGGIAAAIAIRSGQEGLHVYITGNSQERLNDVAAKIQSAGGSATAVTLEAGNSAKLAALFKRIGKEGYQLALVTQGGQRFATQPALDIPVTDIEAQWRSLCFTGCLVGQEAIRHMLPAAQGTLLFLNHSSSSPGVSGMAGAGLRSLAQSMAREFGPKGMHVAHVLLDAADNTASFNAEAVAESCWQLHRQHKTTWTQELDLQPSLQAL